MQGRNGPTMPLTITRARIERVKESFFQGWHWVSFSETLQAGEPVELSCTSLFSPVSSLMNIYWIVNREQESISTPKAYYLHEGGIVLLMCHGTCDLSHVIIMSAY